MIDVYFDGLCQPVNPGGIACYAFLIKRNGKIAHSEYGLATEAFSENSTNNVAEYTALLKALEWLANFSGADEPIRISSDSKLVVSQLNGEYKIKSKRIIPLFNKAVALKNSIPNIEIRWIPRTENREADALTNKAYKEALRSRAKAKSLPDRDV